jgi:hypothetical protein
MSKEYHPSGWILEPKLIICKGNQISLVDGVLRPLKAETTCLMHTADV